MKQLWKVNLTLEYGYQRHLIANTVEAVRPLAECEFMRLIGATPLPLSLEEVSE
jgi:hypothetical protein